MNFSPLANVHTFQLSNGLRVYLKPDRRSPLISAQAWVQVGSVDEPKEEAGLSHVLEHMLFKGTEHFRADQISRWIESLGGSLNAETSKEYTHYYVDVPAHGARQAVTLLAEFLFRATFDPEEWRRECPVILEEMKRRNDDPEAMLWDLLNEALYTHPRLQQPVIGYSETIEAVTPASLRAFYKKHYHADRTLLVIAGDFELKKMRAWVEQAFRAMPGGGEARESLPSQGDFRPSHKRLEQSVHQSYVAFAFPTPPAKHPHQEALDLLAAVLGEGRNARLVESLRETKKLVWSVSAMNLTHQGPGLFGILFDCDAKRRAGATAEMLRLLKQLRSQPPTENELMRGKNLLRTAWLQGYETYHSQAATLGSFAIDGDLKRLEKLPAKNCWH